MNLKMVGRGVLLSAAFLFIALAVSAPAKASDSRMDMISATKDAFHAQVALSEKERSMGEVKQVLTPYFTDEFMDKFINENIVQTDNGYQTFGSDFAQYFIPFFTYEDGKTKAVNSTKDAIYVMEKFVDDGEGPVSFEDGYQWVRWIQTDDGWKIDDIGMGTPEDIAVKKETAKKKDDTPALANRLIGHFLTSFSFSPFKEAFYLFG
ncbi:DUF3993 domain-containing protein [Falsibacillus pallidus]|uniref:Uncharacterized protein DUF3993 n=1 Tax=Falsibacillus pallidus TaxID=493781 RepID=A0A370H0R8_9BACI|nr:DUF3993 domain-containing protein [Falsibacillus pallidus]RDI47643.1 uncharacterized protein DUF3993 [Falsibacillus pallidus]